MKSISASIIVLAAAVVLVGGARIRHGQTQIFFIVIGCGIAWAGLCGGYLSLNEK